jgi:hypothetical protein
MNSAAGRRRVVAAVACFLGLSALDVAHARTLYDALTQRDACFARAYSEAHLRAHPDQTVTRFFLGDPGPDWSETQARAHYNVAFGFRILGSNDAFSGVAICEPRGAVAACDIEGDGGSFTIERNGAGLRIRLGRMQVEGMQEFNADLALRDNRVMLLAPAQHSACRAE